MPRTLGDSFLHVDRITHLAPVDIGMARYDVAPKSNLADVAFVVRDEWQGKGVGTLLMRRMAEIARARGISGFEADVLLTNKAMMRVLEKSGLRLCLDLQAGVYHVTARFEAVAASAPEAGPSDSATRPAPRGALAPRSPS